MSDKFHDRGPGIQPRLVLVGGFLGAGKTSLIGQVVGRLTSEGVDCGVVTNDQAGGLVDTQILEAAGAVSVAEVAGGCFCCRLEDLVEVLEKKWSCGKRGGNEGRGQDAHAPLVVLAEPVGSCTDLMSTVILPLGRVYGIAMDMAPLSVVVDARRALASLGGRRTPGSFAKDVGYIYRKQLEEAEIVVVNKADLMSAEDLSDLLGRLEAEYPGKEVFVTSARTGEGVEAWLERVLGDRAAPERLMEMDYARYGAGEALLGWMNARVDFGDGALPPRDGDGFLLELADAVSSALEGAGMEVAHFKMSLQDGDGRLGVVNQVMGGVPPEISRSYGGSFRCGQLTVNLRAEGDPEGLRAHVEAALDGIARRSAASRRMSDWAAFRPGQPVPTARVTSL